MGLFDDFDIDMDEVKEAGGFDFEDGTYEYEIVEALRQNGTKNAPDDTKFIIKYDLDEAGVYWEFFTIAVDGDSEHAKAKQSLGFLKSRLMDLGFKASELNDIEPEDLEGIRGSLQLLTTSGKGANKNNKYQNVRNVKVFDDDEPEEEPEPAPKKRTARKPAPAPEPEEENDDAAIKRRVAAKRAAREEAETPAKRVTKTTSRRSARAADEEEDENPFE